MALMLSLLAVLVFAPPGEGAAERPVGLEFSKAIPQRDRGPLQDGFTRTLPLACERSTPCVENCSEQSSTVGLELDGSDRNYTLRWVATDPRLDEPLVFQSSCELCSLVELEQQFATDLTRVCSQLDALDAGPGQLAVSSNPSGAQVRVDGQKVGRTPWSGELTAGEHSIELRRIGHLPQRHSVAVVGNVETREHFSLTSSFARQGRPKWPGWTSLGVGIAMAVAGTALISVHGQPWAGRCSGADVDAAGNCRFVLATRPLGITLAVLGAGAIASGVGLMIWAQRDPAGTAAGVTLGGRF
jgi:hypothetical protein